jgi:hypothetical protein
MRFLLSKNIFAVSVATVFIISFALTVFLAQSIKCYNKYVRYVSNNGFL